MEFAVGSDELLLNDGEQTQVKADLVTISASNVAADFGSDAAHLGLSGLDFDLVMASDAGSSSRNWLAFDGLADSASFDSQGLVLAGTDLGVELNLAAADGSVVDWASTGQVGPAQTGFGFATARVAAAGTMTVSYQTEFSATGSVLFELRDETVVIDGDTVETQGFAIGLSNVSGEIAGASVSDIDAGIIVLAADTDSNNDTRSWLALQARVTDASVDAAALGLPPVFSAQVDSLSVSANLAFGSNADGTNDSVLDLYAADADQTLVVASGLSADAPTVHSHDA
jgi:hypothetical protein